MLLFVIIRHAFTAIPHTAFPITLNRDGEVFREGHFPGHSKAFLQVERPYAQTFC